MALTSTLLLRVYERERLVLRAVPNVEYYAPWYHEPMPVSLPYGAPKPTCTDNSLGLQIVSELSRLHLLKLRRWCAQRIGRR